MDYAELSICGLDEQQSEIITAYLADFPFESFQLEERTLRAYIQRKDLIGCRSDVVNMLSEQGLSGEFADIESEDWNAQWEKDFEPVDVDGRVYIRAQWHEPASDPCMEIVVNPRMAFGSGHHVTTKMMVRMILSHSLENLNGLDMGCGTGVLAITAIKCGASHMDAIDIDEFSFENCKENAQLNGVSQRISSFCSDASMLAGRSYDFILANINRNILVADMPKYVSSMHSGSVIFFSGFLEEDVAFMKQHASAYSLKLMGQMTEDGWAALAFTL